MHAPLPAWNLANVAGNMNTYCYALCLFALAKYLQRAAWRWLPNPQNTSRAALLSGEQPSTGRLMLKSFHIWVVCMLRCWHSISASARSSLTHSQAAHSSAPSWSCSRASLVTWWVDVQFYNISMMMMMMMMTHLSGILHSNEGELTTSNHPDWRVSQHLSIHWTKHEMFYF